MLSLSGHSIISISSLKANSSLVFCLTEGLAVVVRAITGVLGINALSSPTFENWPKSNLFLSEDPWVLNFPPCRGPGGSIPTGNVASVVSSNCPLWEERRENTTCLPWVAARKPEEGILEVESYWEFGLS